MNPESFEEMRGLCNEHSELSRIVIDDFLMYYAADKENLEPFMQKEFKKYSKITQTLNPKFINLFKAEYIVSRIFLKNGLLKKLLNHSAVKRLPKNEYEFLEFFLEHPWKFSFSIMIDNPAEDFYTMKDVFTGEEFLLYSKGTTATLSEKNVSIWFNLIAFNGKCWQSFGNIVYFVSMDDNDLFYFATELDSKVEADLDIIESIERNPIPYFMLIIGAEIPYVLMREEEVRYLISTDDCESFNASEFEKDFEIEKNRNVYCLTSISHGGPPHFAKFYVDTENKILQRSSMTLTGFDYLRDQLTGKGYELTDGFNVNLSISMKSVFDDILGQKSVIDEYEVLFAN